MSGTLTIGIIGAAGWLGSAFAEAIIDTGIVTLDHLTLSYRSKLPDRLSQARWTKDNAELASRSDVIIVSVRPHDLPALQIAGGKLIISVMAGITLAELSRHFQTDRVVRTIPNAAAECRKSYTPWVASDGVTASDREIVRRILEACGAADEVKTEMDIDYFTGMTGSGPAFPALLAEAMMEDAIKRSISPEIACRSVNAVLVGAGRLIENRGECPKDIVQTFVDYGGTTAAAIAAMRDAGFLSACAMASKRRSKNR